MALKDFRQGLRPALGGCVAGGHAVADVDVGENVDGEVDGLAGVELLKGERHNSARGVIAVVIAQQVRPQLAIGIIKRPQGFIEQRGSIRMMAWQKSRIRNGEPFFGRIKNEVTVCNAGSQIVVEEKEVRGDPLEKLKDGAGLAGEPGGALPVGIDLRAFGGAQVNGPAVADGVFAGDQIDREAMGAEQFSGVPDGLFESGVFAEDVCLRDQAATYPRNLPTKQPRFVIT